MTKKRKEIKLPLIVWALLPVIKALLLLFAGSAIGFGIMKEYYEKKYASPVNAYYFTEAEVVDPIPNGTKELYITGNLKEGVCFKK